MELTGTNRPRTFINTIRVCARDSYPLYGSQPLHGRRRSYINDMVLSGFPVAIVEGKHPVPFRTRSLSLPTLMVLHEGSCGRVRRCRNTYTVPSPQGSRAPIVSSQCSAGGTLSPGTPVGHWTPRGPWGFSRHSPKTPLPRHPREEFDFKRAPEVLPASPRFDAGLMRCGPGAPRES